MCGLWHGSLRDSDEQSQMTINLALSVALGKVYRRGRSDFRGTPHNCAGVHHQLRLQGATGDLDHVALVAAVDKMGNPTTIAEGTGIGRKGTVQRISWATFMAHVRAQHKKITSYGRDNNDDSAGGKGGSPMFYDAETGRAL